MSASRQIGNRNFVERPRLEHGQQRLQNALHSAAAASLLGERDPFVSERLRHYVIVIPLQFYSCKWSPVHPSRLELSR